MKKRNRLEMATTIFGRVLDNKYRGKIQDVTFQLLDQQTQQPIGKTFFTVGFFCPLNRQDLLYGQIAQGPSGNFLLENPIIEGVHSKEGVKMLFSMATRTKPLPPHEAERLYAYFVNKSHLLLDNRNKDVLLRHQKNPDSLITETINVMVDQWKNDAEGTIQSIHNETNIPIMTLKIIFSWWYKNRMLRRLYLLGFTKTIIKACANRDWDSNKLYYQALDNPYIVEKIPLDLCNRIMDKYGMKINQDVFLCGQIVREVDAQIEAFKHTCVPLYMLEKRFPTLRHQKTLLEGMFGCRFQYNHLYLKYFAEIEDILVKYFTPKKLTETIPDPYLITKLNEEQKTAMKMALEERVSKITGGPGAGKSTLIGTLTEVLNRRRIPFYVTAFTGKAVARAKEIISSENHERVRTLHRLYYGRTDPCQYLIIDEASMVGVEILAKVLRKLFEGQDSSKTPFQILVVGDQNQLQSIDPGNFFVELLRTQIPHVHLERDCRRTKQGILYDNIRYLGARQLDKFQWGEDCMFEDGGAGEDVVLEQVKEWKAELEERDMENPGNLITVVCPYNLASKDNIQPMPSLNLKLRQLFVPADAESLVDAWGNTWKVGDRVMMTDNNYDINVMNGEEGTVVEVRTADILCLFPIGTVAFPTYLQDPYSNEDEESKALSTRLLVLSWAITTHKSQGSQWKKVVYYIPPQYTSASGHMNFCMSYTSISRAEENVACIGISPWVFEQSFTIPAPARNDHLARRVNEAQQDLIMNQKMEELGMVPSV